MKGWVIKIGRGLDFFQKPANWFEIRVNNLSLRKCLETNVDLLKCMEGNTESMQADESHETAREPSAEVKAIDPMASSKLLSFENSEGG